MTLQRGLVFFGIGLMVATVFGLFRNGKTRLSVVFTIYITLATIFTILIVGFPLRYTPEAFMIKQGIYDTLFMCMALELSIKVFAAFRGVATRVRAFLALAVIASTVAIFVLTPQNLTYSDLARYQPEITTTVVWCLSFVALLIVWYQIPVPAFTRAILLGFIPYQMVFVIYTDLIGRLGWGALPGLNLLNTVAYDAVAAYWAYAAWRKDEVIT
ncbi:MAG: hypothetical protein ABI672_04945 [Vicinamibacteria bacterium]